MTDNYSTTLNAGSFKGRCYRHVRVSRPHTKSQEGFVLDAGNHFKTLDALIDFVCDEQSRAACEAGKSAACPDQHACRHGIDN